MDDNTQRVLYVRDEIIEEILSRLLVKSLLRFRCVCKTWKGLISGSRFSNLRLLQSIRRRRSRLICLRDTSVAFEYGSIATTTAEEAGDSVGACVLAYCHGLFCLGISNKAYLWNPSTREIPRITSSPVDFPPISELASVFFGLGHRRHTDDYALVRIALFHVPDLSFRTEVKVYSRNTGMWRRIGDFPYDYPYPGLGVAVDGSIHRIVSMSSVSMVDRRGIAFLDLMDDTYGLIGLPPYVLQQLFNMASLDDNLILFYTSIEEHTATMWSLRQHPMADSWTKLFNISVDCVSTLDASVYFQPLCMLEPGRILVRVGADKIVTVNVGSSRCDDIRYADIAKCKVISYVESLVSPHPTFVK